MMGVRRAEEVVVPLATPVAKVPIATHARGTVLCSSLRSHRARGLEERYLDVLDPRHRDFILSATAAIWIPTPIMLAHYEACDRLELDRETIASIGAESGKFIYARVVELAIRFSVGAGATTPWSVLENSYRLRERTWRGSDMEIRKAGPKDARVTWYGMPCARSPYYRFAFASFLSAVLEPFCTRVEARVEPSGCGDTTAAYWIAWA